MFCVACGASVVAPGRFCQDCGRPTGGSAAATVPDQRPHSSVQDTLTDKVIAQHAARIVAAARSAVAALGVVPSSSESASYLLCQFIYLGVLVTVRVVGEDEPEAPQSLDLPRKLATQSILALVDAEASLSGSVESITDRFVKRVDEWGPLPLTADEEEQSVMRSFLQSALICLYTDPRDRRMTKKVRGHAQDFLSSLGMETFARSVVSSLPPRRSSSPPQRRPQQDQPSGERILGEFKVGWVGTPEGLTLHLCICKVTNARIIVSGHKGTRQVHLRDVLGVRVDGIVNKLVKIDTPEGCLVISAKKDTAMQIPACIHEALDR